MSFATRCTACGTIFRVVQDQLKVSDGWVRCGRCDAVFDAAGGLFDLEHDAPPEWQQTAPPTPETEPAAQAAADANTEASGESEDERRWSASMAAQGLAPEPGPTSRPPPGSAAPPAFPPATVAPAGVAPSTAPPVPHAPTYQPPAPFVFDVERADIGTGILAEDLEDEDAITITDHPSSLRGAVPRDEGAAGRPAAGVDDFSAAPAGSNFLHRTGRNAFWHSGRVRTLLGLLALGLLAALGLQAAQQFSELAAARLPALRPALTAWCGLSHCPMGPPHRIDDIVVENTALTTAPAPASGLRLAVTLRNRADYAVALPSIDLSLTDLSGRLIARRALTPADFRLSAPTPGSAPALAAGADLPLQATLATAEGSAPVAGYTVEIFYP